MANRVTNVFTLGVAQGGVDFVDVDVDGDVPVFIDPTAIRLQRGDWADACVVALQSFFAELLTAIKADDRTRMVELIYPLTEPNETHLGSSQGEARGRSLGTAKKAEDLIDSLRKSKAVRSGFLRDLEDSALMVEGIDKDIISDITTCVIRAQLIDYTQQQAAFHGIPMEFQDSGPAWNVGSKSWVTSQVKLPRAGGNKLLLVPRSVVRVKLTVDKGRYYRGYLRPYFEDEVLANPRAGLVRTLKDNSLRVIKGALDDELGTTKPDIIRHTQKHPSALEDYKSEIESEDPGPLSDETLAERIGTEIQDSGTSLTRSRQSIPAPLVPLRITGR